MSQFQDELHKYCKEHYPGLIRIARFFVNRTKYKNDNHIAVEGRTGHGKSMVTFIIIHLMYKMMDKVYDIAKQTLFVPTDKQLNTQMSNLKDRDVWWLDEAIKALDKKLWYKMDQIKINQKVKTERFKLNSIFYNIQRFGELNESFRNHNIHSRLVILNRYAVVLRVVDDDVDIDDPWHTKENIAIKFKNKYNQTRYTIQYTQEERLRKEQALPNYLDHEYIFDINEIPQFLKYWNYYEYLKTKSRIDAAKDDDSPDKGLLNIRDTKFKNLALQLIKISKQKNIPCKDLRSQLNFKEPNGITGRCFYDLWKQCDAKESQT